MNPVSPLPAITCLFIAFVTAFFLTKVFGAPPDQGRFSTIDGLRGYLAFFVFLHHSSIWYFYLRTGYWDIPPSNLYTHFGQSSVALFFMITGFLFFSKLIDGRTKRIDWGKLYISRFLRLAPLYFFVSVALFLVVARLSDGVLNEPVLKLLKNMARWLGFTVLGTPDLNTIENTAIIIARVTWSLRYEWIFYFSLPALAILVRATPPLPYIILGITSIAVLIMSDPQIHHLLAFLGGIIASLLVRWDSFRVFSARRISSFIIIGCLYVAVSAFPSSYRFAPIFLLSVVFSLIASGNNLFGILANPVSRTLGELAYGIYLLHGITLFITFNFVIGLPISSSLSPISHWLIVLSVTPILICICFVTFRFVERPSMQSAPLVTAWIRCFFSKGRTAREGLRQEG